jgi:signal peptidase I
VGDPIVFQTGEIDEYNKKLRQDGLAPKGLGWRSIGEDKYYIKRLVGTPGDKLKVQIANAAEQRMYAGHQGIPGKLLSNGKPIEGCQAFEGNRKAADYFVKHPHADRSPSGFPAYRATGLLSEGTTLEVPPKSFFAMGDNSPDSLDGRAWGFIPQDKVVGRAMFVYYPFTAERWGISD